jgi:hypothetical protein
MGFQLFVSEQCLPAEMVEGWNAGSVDTPLLFAHGYDPPAG